MSSTFNADTLLKKRARHQLPEQAYVTLSQALSWLAFNVPLDFSDLEASLRSGETASIQEARQRLIKAVDRLADAASSGRIEMRGKFVSHGSDDGKAKTEPMPPHAFHDFARFDVFCDGLNIGRGLAWRFSSDRLLDTAMIDKPEEAYRSVMVNRDELIASLGKEKRPSPFKTGKRPDAELVRRKSDEMREAHGMTTYEIAREMKKEEGFENAYTTYVREVIRGRYPVGRAKRASTK